MFKDSRNSSLLVVSASKATTAPIAATASPAGVAIKASAAALMAVKDTVAAFAAATTDPKRGISIATAPAIPAVATVSILSASNLIPSAKARDAPTALSASPINLVSESFSICIDCPTVADVLEKSASTDCDTDNNALVTVSAVNLPSSAIARNSPRETPKPFAIASITAGVCSAIELNSSPRNTPLAKACPN